MRTSYSVAQKTGALTCGISVLWIFFIGIQGAWNQLGQATDWVDGLLRMVLPVLLSGPGVVLSVLSWQLMRRDVTRERIKLTLGVLSGFAALFIAGFFIWQIEVWGDVPENDVGFGLALFVSVLIILPTYAGVARYVMRASGIVPVKGEFIGQGSYMLLAFLLWAILSPLGRALHEDYQTDRIWDFGFTFIPLLIPYILYRLAVKYLVRDTIAEQVALDNSSAQRSHRDI